MLVLRAAEFCQHSVLHIARRSGYGRAILPGGYAAFFFRFACHS